MLTSQQHRHQYFLSDPLGKFPNPPSLPRSQLSQIDFTYLMTALLMTVHTRLAVSQESRLRNTYWNGGLEREVCGELVWGRAVFLKQTRTLDAQQTFMTTRLSPFFGLEQMKETYPRLIRDCCLVRITLGKYLFCEAPGGKPLEQQMGFCNYNCQGVAWAAGCEPCVREQGWRTVLYVMFIARHCCGDNKITQHEYKCIFVAIRGLTTPLWLQHQ